MKRLEASLAILLIAAGCLRAQGDNAPAVQKLAAALEQEFAGGHPPAGTPSPPPEGSAQAALAHFRAAVASGDEAAAGGALDQVALYVQSPRLRDECIAIREGLRLEQQAKNQQTINDIEDAVKDAALAARSARKPADLDGPLARLDAILARHGAPANGQMYPLPSWPPPLVDELTKVQRTRLFVAQWQDGLQQCAKGDAAGGAAALHQASNFAIPFFPRSEMLARIEEFAAAASVQTTASIGPSPSVIALLEGIKTLDQLGPALDALDKIGQLAGDRRRPQAKAALKCLSLLQQNYCEYAAGGVIDIVSLVRETSPDGLAFTYGQLVQSGSDDLVRVLQETVPGLRSQLLALVLPRALNLPTALQAKPGEVPDDFLQRVKTSALAAGDYVGAAMAEQTLAFLRSGNQSTAAGDEAAAYISAKRLDSARQYAYAVTEYERALASGCDLVPAKLIGDRLEMIQAQHPREYEFGFQYFLATPEQRRSFAMSNIATLLDRPAPAGSRPPGQPSPAATPGKSVPP